MLAAHAYHLEITLLRLCGCLTDRLLIDPRGYTYSPGLEYIENLLPDFAEPALASPAADSLFLYLIKLLLQRLE
jgi:hypothetical protein